MNFSNHWNMMKKLFLLFTILQIIKLDCFAQNNQTASISVDLTQPVQSVTPMLFGQFIEYLGRCIDGGIYEENSVTRCVKL